MVIASNVSFAIELYYIESTTRSDRVTVCDLP